MWYVSWPLTPGSCSPAAFDDEMTMMKVYKELKEVRIECQKKGR